MKPESSSEAEAINDGIIKSTTNDLHDSTETAPKRLLFAQDADYTIISLTLGVCAALLLFILVLVFVSCRQPINDKHSDIESPNSLLNDIVVIHS